MVAVNDVRLTTEYQNSTSADKKLSALEISAFNVPGATSETFDCTEKSLKETRIEHIKQDLEVGNNKISYNDALEFIKIAFGYEEKDFGNISNEEFTKIEEILLSALDHPAKNKDNNVKKALGIANFYKKAIENGNTYEQARSLIDNFGDMSILNVLKAYNPEINEYKTLADIPMEKLEACLTKIIDKFKDSNDKNHVNRMFKNLLDRTSDDDKKILWEAFKNIASSDEKIQMLADTVNKFENKEKLQAFLKSFTPEVIKALGLNENDIATATSLIAQNLDEEGVRKLQQLSFEFAEKINVKAQELKNKKPEEYTEEDKAVLKSLEFIKRSVAGLMAGTQKNEIISTECKEEVSNNIITESKNLNMYDDLLNNLAKFVKEHPEQDLKESLDKYTNGDFTKAYDAYVAKIEAENAQQSSNNAETNSSEENFGFIQTAAIDPLELKEAQQAKIDNYFEKEDKTIIVEKDEQKTTCKAAPSLIGKNVTDLNKLIEEGVISAQTAVKQSLKQYNQLSTSIKNWVENQVERMSKGARYNLLANTAGSAVVKIVSHTNINSDEIDTKSIGYDARKAIERMEENKPRIGLV